MSAHNPTDFDQIIIGSHTVAYLRNKSALPSEWGLTRDEEARILAAAIRITSISSPATKLSLGANPFKMMESLHLVIFSSAAFDAALLTREEIIAGLLHEIGHVINTPRNDAFTSTDKVAELYATEMTRKAENAVELEADDYVRHCGYGGQLVGCLEKFALHDKKGFESPLTQKRVARIKSDEKKILHFK